MRFQVVVSLVLQTCFLALSTILFCAHDSYASSNITSPSSQTIVQKEIQSEAPHSFLNAPDFYMQNSTDSRTQQWVSEGRLRYFLNSRQGLYWGMGWTWQIERQPDATATAKLENFAAPMLGYLWRSPNLPVGFDTRLLGPKQRWHTQSALDMAALEVRAVGFHSYDWQLNKYAIAETYSELVYRSLFTQNLFLQNQNRFGLRLRLSQFFMDALLEGIVHQDLQRQAWENFADLRVAARVGTKFEQGQLFLQVSRSTDLYWGERDFLNTWKGVLVMGVSL